MHLRGARRPEEGGAARATRGVFLAKHGQTDGTDESFAYSVAVAETRGSEIDGPGARRAEESTTEPIREKRTQRSLEQIFSRRGRSSF